MSHGFTLEAVGYLGSILVIVSMLMTSVVKLRIINLIGSLIFTAYAVLIASYPTAFLNACLVIINVHQLRKLHRSAGRSYDLHEIKGGDGFTAWFIGKYLDDIRTYFPDFEPEKAAGTEGYAVFYEDQAAGILLGTRTEDSIKILIDYTTPAFRDCSVGPYLYEQLALRGIRRLSCESSSLSHVRYMLDMGFRQEGDNLYIREIQMQ